MKNKKNLTDQYGSANYKNRFCINQKLRMKSFTLVEIILALAILGIGLVGILSVFVVGANTVRRTVETTEASFIAQMVFEDFKSQAHSINSPTNFMVPSIDIDAHYNNYTFPTNPSPAHVDTLITLNISKTGRSKPIASFVTYITKYEP